MIKKYQLKKHEGPYSSKSGQILPEILAKSDKKLADSQEKNRIAQIAARSIRPINLNKSHTKPKMLEALHGATLNNRNVHTSSTHNKFQ